MVKVSLFMNLKNEKMDKAELLKNRLQASIDFAVKMNEDFEAISWNYQEGVLLNHNEAKLVVELIKKLTLTNVIQQSELLAFIEEVSEFDALVSSTRLRLRAKELLKNYT
jgi:hypothetical protein